MKIDMHCHSRGSDGHGNPADFVAALQKAGIDGIALTDHHKTLTFEGMAVTEAIRKAGFTVIQGCEYSTAQGHVLCYGVDVADLQLGQYPPMQLVIDRVYNAGGLAVPSHPYRRVNKYWIGDGILKLQKLTAIEAINGENLTLSPRANDSAKAAAIVMGRPMIGGSDAHWTHNIGMVFTEFHGAQNEAQILDALREGACTPHLSSNIKSYLDAESERRAGAFSRLQVKFEKEYGGTPEYDAWLQKNSGRRQHAATTTTASLTRQRDFWQPPTEYPRLSKRGGVEPDGWALDREHEGAQKLLAANFPHPQPSKPKKKPSKTVLRKKGA